MPGKLNPAGTNQNGATGAVTGGRSLNPFSPDVEQPVEARKGHSSKVDERTPLKQVLNEKAVEETSLTRNPIKWIGELREAYSWRLLAMVVCTNHLLKGFVAGGGDEGLVGKPIEFIFGGLGISAARLQILKAAAIAPWALKPVIALLSDAVPIAGYKKMPYVIIFTILSLIGCLLIGTGMAATVPAIVGCLFLIFLQVSSIDLLVEAKQSEEVKKSSKLGPHFFTFTWLGINIGQVCGVCLVGALIHNFGPRLPYLVALPFVALVLWPTLSNFLGEKPIPSEERRTYVPLVMKHTILCSLTLLIGMLIIGLITLTFFLSEGQLLSFRSALPQWSWALSSFLSGPRSWAQQCSTSSWA